jgi:hypothetical protein
MKKNNIRLTKLEDKIIKGEPVIFELSRFELLEHLEELLFKQGKKPTQKFLDKKRRASKARPTFNKNQYQRLRAEEAEWQAEKEAMSYQEIIDSLNKLRKKHGREGDFEDMSEQEIKDYNKPEKEAVT